MKIHTFDGKQYIALGDFNHLRQNLIRDIYDKYEKAEDGYHLSTEDMGRVDAYTHIMTQILKDELAEAAAGAEDAGELRKNYDRVYGRIRSEWMMGKYAIVATDKTQGKPAEVYYARTDLADDGETETPVFTAEKRKARVWDDYYSASNYEKHMKELTKDMGEAICDVEAVPLYMIYTDARERLLKAIFGEDYEPRKSNRGDAPEGCEGWCIFLEPEEGERDEMMWFGEWVKNREDQPQWIRDWLEQAGVKPSESAPLFKPADKGCMIFAWKNLAERTVERIEEKYPEMKGKLHVMPYEVMDTEEGEEEDDEDGEGGEA